MQYRRNHEVFVHCSRFLSASSESALVSVIRFFSLSSAPMAILSADVLLLSPCKCGLKKMFNW